jgi:hypothetical protein
MYKNAHTNDRLQVPGNIGDLMKAIKITKKKEFLIIKWVNV